MEDIVALLVFAVLLVTINSCEAQTKIYTGTKNFNYQVKWFSVPVDHFNFADNRTFCMRYLYNDSFVDETSTRPSIFFYTGNEGDIEWFAENTGLVWELAKKNNAYVVYAEHRYYGKSLPFGNNSFNISNGNLGFFSVEQTLEDFTLLITHLQKDRQMPVIAFGGSYGGMLAAWFRMKYPHIVHGALAASAPIFQFTNLTPCDIFARITTSIFTTAYNSNCSINIAKSWKAFEALAASENGKKQLHDIFNLCDPIKNANDLIQFLNYIEDIYGNLAMANYPYSTNFFAPMPAYPVRQFCLYLKDLHTDNVKLLQALNNGLNVYTNYSGNVSCLNWKADGSSPNADSFGWNIQTCGQIVIPMCSSSKNSMYRDIKWDIKTFSEECYTKFKLRPRPFDMIQRYGGKHIETATNIIFSNGLLDPWSGGGVLQTPNDRVTVLILPEGAHHLDLRSSNPADPASVTDVRTQEGNIISQWISEFYSSTKS